MNAKSEISPDTGYSRELFIESKPKWTDERLVGGAGEKIGARYHDKEKTLQILNGLCFDIFFRAEEIGRGDFKNIPDCAVPFPQKASTPAQRIESSKPLDSEHKKRTYILKPEEEKKVKPVRSGQMKRFRRRRQR